MSNTHEYDAILAALEAKKDAINQAIAVIRDLMGNGNPMPSRGPMPICADQKRPAQTVQPVQGRPFHGMGTMEATLAFLRSARRPQKAGEIVKALREGGVNTTSKNFYNNVFSILNRKASKPGSDIVKFETGFGLSAWKSRTPNESQVRSDLNDLAS